jgi:hypothetical protein
MLKNMLKGNHAYLIFHLALSAIGAKFFRKSASLLVASALIFSFGFPLIKKAAIMPCCDAIAMSSASSVGLPVATASRI